MKRPARTISRQYRYILVDEYQDTNRLQAEVIRQLASTHQNVMVVGDDSAVDLCVPRRDVQEHHGVSHAVPRHDDV